MVEDPLTAQASPKVTIFPVMKLPKHLTRLAVRLYTWGETRDEGTGLPIQTGALPWRLGREKRPEVLLVTGRTSGRWIIPKGWPMQGKTLAWAAAQEAFEEAGVKGIVDPKPLGTFRHVKQSLLVGPLEVNILVHPLAVERELPKWPEYGQRKRKWFTVREAADSVDSPELANLILQLSERIRAAARS